MIFSRMINATRLAAAVCGSVITNRPTSNRSYSSNCSTEPSLLPKEKVSSNQNIKSPAANFLKHFDDSMHYNSTRSLALKVSPNASDEEKKINSSQFLKLTPIADTSTPVFLCLAGTDSHQSAGQSEKMPVVLTNLVGGTIGMKTDENGNNAIPADPAEIFIPQKPSLTEASGADFKFVVCEDGRKPSEDMTPMFVQRLANAMKQQLEVESTSNEIMGTIITQGTDTVASTANQLLFSLPKEYGPVVITCAMAANGHKEADGPRNLKNSACYFKTVKDLGIGPVVIINGNAIAASNVYKIKSEGLDGVAASHHNAIIGMFDKDSNFTLNKANAQNYANWYQNNKLVGNVEYTENSGKIGIIFIAGRDKTTAIDTAKMCSPENGYSALIAVGTGTGNMGGDENGQKLMSIIQQHKQTVFLTSSTGDSGVNVDSYAYPGTPRDFIDKLGSDKVYIPNHAPLQTIVDMALLYTMQKPGQNLSREEFLQHAVFLPSNLAMTINA